MSASPVDVSSGFEIVSGMFGIKLRIFGFPLRAQAEGPRDWPVSAVSSDYHPRSPCSLANYNYVLLSRGRQAMRGLEYLEKCLVT
jgi:hypothetical protein